MIKYDKDLIKESLTIEQIFELVQEWGGEPEYTERGFTAATICHNMPGEGSRKLYYYDNTKLFNCYTDCGGSFDIFQLVVKVQEIQKNRVDYTLGHALQYIAYRFNFDGASDLAEEDRLQDWIILDAYEKIKEILIDKAIIILKEYNKEILLRFNYNVNIKSWLDEGITKEVMKLSQIGFYPKEEQITIPHFDKDNRLVGIRGRFLGQEEAIRFGKYRPLLIGNQLYNHPLGLNLYNLNNSAAQIAIMKKAIIFEGEKSTLLYRSYFGIENDISVACCGSSITHHQIESLIDSGAQEIIIAFDKQFKEIGDDEFKRLTRKLIGFNKKYGNFVNLSFIFDKGDILEYKDSPIDKGKENFLKLWQTRITL